MDNSILFFIICLLFVIQRYFTVSALKIRGNTHAPPLNDKGFDSIPHLRSAVYSYFIDVLLYSSLILGFFCLDKKQTNLFLISTLYIFSIRLICLYVTRLPYSGINCKNSNHILIKSNECTTDYIFSGHTSLFLLVLLHLREIYPTYDVLFLVLFTALVYLIVGTRSHYTVDVVIAIVLTYCIYVIVDVKHKKVSV